MNSFRTEIENPLVEKDILDLEKKIRLHHEGKIDPEKFRSLRLARGVYGQRQQGVQMIRIKLPFGKVTTKQLRRIADISDEFSNGNLHLTTRQDIQIHYVSLDRTPELWSLLEKDDVTLREACGNTVRNVTASAEAGIDPKEPFDVSPYAQAAFAYFLRKAFGQELGRKFKIAFSSNDEDSAYTFMHDIGFIPRVAIVNGKLTRGFKVLVGGGLGAQPHAAEVAHAFLEEDQIIPFTEAVIRVFDRHGERNNRHKARIKYLIAQIGIEVFLKLVEEEKKAVLEKTFSIDKNGVKLTLPANKVFTTLKPADPEEYQRWKDTSTFEQKQQGFFGVYIKVQLGNISSKTARELARVAEAYAADDIRITINQGLLLKYVSESALSALYRELKALHLADAGFTGAGYITSCPGTDTCNLGISSSTGISKELERVIREEYPDLIYEKDLKIKISGCMNACGQHSLAQIGFHGSSIKAGNQVLPALQLLLGGGVLGAGKGRFSDKILKFPSKRGPDVLRAILNDYEDHASHQEIFNQYYDRKGKDYFYQLLKKFSDVSVTLPEEFIDWGQSDKFQTAIGVGECAGVMIDLVQTLFFEADEKLQQAEETYLNQNYGDAIYHTYAALIQSAKGLLLSAGIQVNTQHSILEEFEKNFGLQTKALDFTFKEFTLRIKENTPGLEFATGYLAGAKKIIHLIHAIRKKQLEKTIV